MLVLSRKEGETIMVKCGEEVIKITLVEIRGPKVRLGLGASKTVEIHREEIWNERLAREAQPQEG